MKLLLFLLAAGLVSANISFNVGQEYVFKYHGKVLTGLPDIDAHFAGFTIACDVLIQNVDATTFKLALKNAELARFHEKLEGPEPMNWRTLMTPAAAPVDAGLLTFLESPVVFQMANGEVTDIKVSGDEPQWTVNMKKALLDLVKIQFPTMGANNFIPDFFQIMEAGIDGICENTYTITELPAHLIRDPTSWTNGILKHELCADQKIFQITKVRDVTKCEKLNLYVSRTKMKTIIKARTHFTKFVGCGVTKDAITLHGAIHEGEIVQNIANTEPMVTGIHQLLQLVEIRPTLTQLPSISNPATTQTVLYEFPIQSDVVHHHTMAAPFAKFTKTPLKWEKTRVQMPGFALAVVKAEIIKELKQIAIDVATTENVAHKNLIPKLIHVLRNFLTLTVEEMTTLHVEIQKLAGVEVEVKQAMVALYFDVATMAGTTHSVQFLKHVVETEQIHQVRILATIMTLGHHVRTPTVEILNHIFTIIKAPVVLKNKLIKHNALLNFANLLNKACVAQDEPKHFPAEVFGEFCSSATSEIVTTYVPYILNEFETTNDEEYKEICLFALGTIGHEAVVPVLLPYVQDTVAGTTTTLRVKSIFALNTVVKKHKDFLLPVFTAIFENPVEHRPVRIAALSMILKAEPNFALMQKIAISTWYEKDPEMTKFIFATLKSLAEKDFANMANIGYLKKIAGMARTVLPLAKPLPGMLFYTGSVFTTEYLKNLYAGFEAQTHFVLAPHGNTIFHKMVLFIDQIKLPALELGAHLKGEKTLFDQLHQVFAEVLGAPQQSNVWDTLHAEWKKIVKEMKFKPREDVPFSTFLYMNMFDDIVAHVGANQLTLDAVKPLITTAFGNPQAAIKAICGKKIPINFIHAYKGMSAEIIHATELGLPLVTETHTPFLFAVQGYVHLTDCGATIPTVEIALKTKVIRDQVINTGVVIPLTKEIVSVTTSAHISFNKPIKAVIKIEPATRKMIFKVMPFVEPTATAVDLFHYHVRAFTAIWKIDEFTFEKELVDMTMKDIRAKTTPIKLVKKIGTPLGLDFTFDMETDSTFFDIQTFMDRAAWYQYNPVHMIMFPGLLTAARRNGMPSKRFHKMTVLFNPAKTMTKEVHLDVEVALAKMLANMQPVQYNVQYLPKFKIIETPLTKATPIEVKLLTALKEKLNVHKNFALTTLFTVELKGGAGKTASIGLTAGLGLDKAVRKWHVHAELMPQTAHAFHICTGGRLDKPVIPAWNIEKLLATPLAFNLKNRIGFGKTCEEFKINFDGVASVSKEQKAFAKNSHEAVLCKNKHVACHKQRDQAATIDHLVLNFNPVKLPAYLTAYITKYGFFKQVTVQFNTHLDTFAITATHPDTTLTLNNIRLPLALHGVLPLVAGKWVHEQVHEALTGTPFRATCHVTETGHIQTFDERFYSYHLDDCYHVVASDCTAKFTTAVLAKTQAGLKHAKVYHMDNEIELKFPTVVFNGQTIEIPQTFEKVIKSGLTIRRTVDDVFIVDTPVFVVEYNGHRIQVKSKQIKITGQMCGLCGDNNKDSRFDLKSPTTCIYKSDLLAALSYRHQTPKCSTLPKEKMDLIAVEEAQCAKHMVPSPKPQFQPMIGSRMKHYTIKNIQGQLCISKSPLPSCLSSFIPMSSIQLMVPYTCITHPSNKIVKHYEQKVNNGVMLPELNMLDTHMTAPTSVPQYCSHV